MPKENKEIKKSKAEKIFSVDRFADSYAKLSNPESPYRKAFMVWTKTKKINKMNTYKEWEDHFKKFIKDKI